MISRSAALIAISVGLAAPATGQPPVTRHPADPPAAVGGMTSVRPIPVSVYPPDPIGVAIQPLPTTTAPGAGSPAGCPTVIECPTPCGPPGRVWANVEWLYWVTSGQPLPPLAVTALPGTPQAVAGSLGTPTTAVLFGGDRVNKDFRNGFRVTAGFWFNDDQTCGLEGEFFFLGGSRDGFAAGSNGTQIIGRPFFNALLGRPDAELVSFPGVVAGTLTVDSRSEVIGGGVNALNNLWCCPNGRVDLLWGYRYFNLTDDVTVGEDLNSLGGTDRIPSGFRFQITDRFRTENDFHGGLLGLAAERRCSVAFVGVRASVALGANRQITDIEGTTVTTPPGGLPQTHPGGLLALPTNMGRHERTVFAVMPQVGVRAGVQLTDAVRLYAGYDFVYLSDVLRAGDQIDLRVNPTFLPPIRAAVGPARPAFAPQSSDFWMHGVSAGVQLRF